jgi:hypothetical protein
MAAIDIMVSVNDDMGNIIDYDIFEKPMFAQVAAMTTVAHNKNNNKQAVAELCQAQFELGLAKIEIFFHLTIEVVFHLEKLSSSSICLQNRCRLPFASKIEVGSSCQKQKSSICIQK